MLYHSPRNETISLSVVILITACAVLVLVVSFPLFSKPAQKIATMGTWWHTPVSTLPVHIVAVPDPFNLNTFIVQLSAPAIKNTKLFSQQHEWVGTITSVLNNNKAQVQLLSSPKNTLPGSLLVGDQTTTVTLIGRGNGVFMFELPHEAKVEKGTVVHATEGGYLLGTVVDITTKKQDPYQKIFVAPSQGIESMAGFVTEGATHTETTSNISL